MLQSYDRKLAGGELMARPTTKKIIRLINDSDTILLTQAYHLMLDTLRLTIEHIQQPDHQS